MNLNKICFSILLLCSVAAGVNLRGEERKLPSESACDGYTDKKANGLCVAYYAIGCLDDPLSIACTRISDNFEQITGESLTGCKEVFVSSQDGPGDIRALYLLTKDGIPVIPPSTPGEPLLLSELAADPSTGTIYTRQDGTGQFATLDIATGTVTVLSTGFADSFRGAMAVNPLDGGLYRARNRVGTIEAVFHSIDKTTGEATLLGPLPADVPSDGMAFRSDGTLFAVANRIPSLNPGTELRHELYKIHLTPFYQAELVGYVTTIKNNEDSAYLFNGIAFDSSDFLYSITNDGQLFSLGDYENWNPSVPLSKSDLIYIGTPPDLPSVYGLTFTCLDL